MNRTEAERFFDPISCRVWRVLSWHPIRPDRPKEGMRVRIADERNVISIVCERDLHVLTTGLTPHNWEGVAADEIDAATDLYMWECALRDAKTLVPRSTEILRAFRYQEGLEHEELWIACHDPAERVETAFHTLLRRWVRVERRPLGLSSAVSARRSVA